MNIGSVREPAGRINVFISHAGEDIDLARALQSSIESVCGPDNVDVFLDYDKISFGSEIPEVIKDALGRSSFFIGVATHNLRNQFSWCGLELGYFFAAGKNVQEIWYLYHDEIQDVFKPYLGAQIVALEEKHKTTLPGPLKQVPDSPMYRLLIQIGVRASKLNFPEDPIKFFESLRTAAEAGAISITDAYVEQLRRNAKQARYPQSRLKVTIPIGLNPKTLPTLIKKATVSIYPKAAFYLKIPSSTDESPAEIQWDSFSDRMRSLCGGPHLSSIIYEIIDAFLPSQFDAKNDYLVQVPDNHSFRVILVRYEMFGDGQSEFVFNMIETLVPLQGGDPRTTLITSAIVMATQFRSLFIEHDATYAISIFETSGELLSLTKEMVRDLRRVHIESANLRFNEPALTEALGSPEQIHDWHVKWWPPVSDLENFAQSSRPYVLVFTRI
jgi:TIR domain